MRDVIVVGAGPAGSQAARHLADAGHDVLLLEEHPEVGQPVQCAGLFTPRIFDLVDFDADAVRYNDIRGAHVHAPDGRVITLDGGRTMAIALDRAGFDARVAEGAVGAGAELALATKAVGLERHDGGVRVQLRDVRTGATRVEDARLLVGADGVQSRIAKWTGLSRAREILPCYGSQTGGVTTDTPGFVEMFIGQDRAPGFFSWIIPTDPAGASGKVEVGVRWDAPLPAERYYQRMFEDPASARFLPDPAAGVNYGICGCIPVGYPQRTTADRVMLVGDAASQAKPTSGGGVYTGLTCARHLADVATDALSRDELSHGSLRAYHDAWMGDIGRELRIGWWLRKAFMNLTDEQMNELFETIDDPKLLATVNELGDIDYPSRLAKALLRKAPSLFKYSGTLVKALFDKGTGMREAGEGVGA